MHDLVYFIFDYATFCCSTLLHNSSFDFVMYNKGSNFLFISGLSFYKPVYLSSFWQGGDPSQERNYSLEVISCKGSLVSRIQIQYHFLWNFLSIILLFAFSLFSFLVDASSFHLLIDDRHKI
jgi:hypothetical protein